MLANDRPVVARTSDNVLHWPVIDDFKASCKRRLEAKVLATKVKPVAQILRSVKTLRLCNSKKIHREKYRMGCMAISALCSQ